MRQLLACLLLGGLFFNALASGEGVVFHKYPPAEAEQYEVAKLLELAQENAIQDIELTLAFLEIARRKANAKNNSRDLFQIERKTGYAYENHNQLDSALLFYQKALKHSLASRSAIDQMTVYTDLAIANRRLANYNKSKDYHLEVLKIALKEGNKRAIGNSYHGLGTLYKEIGYYEEAVNYFLKAVTLRDEENDTPNAINIMQYVATTYAESGNLDLAKKTIEDAYQKALVVNDSMLIGLVAFDVGKILGLAGEYEFALEKFHTSLDVFEKKKHKPLIARSLFYLADTYSQLEFYEQAHQYFERCQADAQYISLRSLADLNYKIGNLFFKQKEDERAKKAFEKSLELAEEYKFKDFCQKSNWGLYEIYQKEQNFQLANYHLRQSIKFKDSLFSEGKAKKITELQFKYESEKQEKAIQSLQLRQNRFWLIGGAAIFALTVLFFGYILRLRNKSNNTLLKKNEAIQSRNIKLRESNEVLRQFTYVAAHDLKEPLRNITSFVNLIQRKFQHEVGDEINEYMHFVIKGSKRMNDLINALLEYSTISMQKPSDQKVNVENIIKDVCENLSIVVKNKQAIIDYPLNLPKIKMDPIHLTQLFQNLIGNALKFTTNTPHIQINGEVKKEQIVYTVKDNGIGINEDYAHKVYNLFHQLHRDKDYEGTGIGLTICKNIVDKYNGHIWFESEKGMGTKFFISFPHN